MIENKESPAQMPGHNERTRSVDFRGIILKPMITHSATLHKPTDTQLYLARDHCTSC